MQTFYDLEKESVLKHYGKGENAGTEHFLYFTLCFQNFSMAALLKGGLSILTTKCISIMIKEDKGKYYEFAHISH